MQPSPPPVSRPKTPPDANQNDPVFFFKANEQNGAFCQWYPATFTVTKQEMSDLVGHEIDPDDPWTPIYFNCAEQFMMYCKAGRFRDKTTQQLILATKDPKEQKRIASKAKGFDAQSWDKIKSQVVVAGSIAKFEQNPKLRNLLLDTRDRLLVEAASEDRVWGIGLTAKEAMIPQNRKEWGENRLGKALMEARKHLRDNRV
ncbi:uncharacterized protein B0I36DRAFT_392516 [Microdochium trichocladiopsis]|uniref:NADAR domain-containing protein n=1 Tax=Microdochium trichocladiopsis TaxID=1682393 RepID=A0A9P9BUZ0_9PEZI|nr:uncharacterized protein B0I36DRAFT_392516 [Microdochium trichocladiopsis]KAH7041486.1 hypothetical protein B0I36DRAFT_392516 [Microdochium trichocladiopsis]